jgi:glyoxylase-like metal-dependent hydrolase (beta-lactamase superfamily II)
MLNIKRFTFNPFAENSYIVWDSETNDAAVVDPGCYDHEERNEIGNFIKSNSLKLKYLILTHCHLDHIFGSCYIKTNFDVTYYAPEEDLPLLKQASQQASMFGLEILEICLPDKFIKDDLELNLGKIKIEFLFTPGHTPGGYCLYFRDQNICITGDVLFDGSIGRTDLPGGNYDQIIKSVREKLLVLPEDTKVYPGHGEMTTIGKEKKYNPFLTDK